MQLEDLRSLASDVDEAVRSEARAEIASVGQQRAVLTDQLISGLLPDDNDDSCDVVLEIRAGTGGLEASAFATELFAMYQSYAGIYPCTRHRQSLTNAA